MKTSIISPLLLLLWGQPDQVTLEIKILIFYLCSAWYRRDSEIHSRTFPCNISAPFRALLALSFAMLFSAHPPKHPTFWELSLLPSTRTAHSHHSQSFRHRSLLAAQEDGRQTPESIQLPQKQAPSLWELERGTERFGLLILSPRGAKPEFRELEVREQADICSERAARGGGPPAPSCLRGTYRP